LRSRVGPTGLRQDISADDGGKRARSPGRARRKPLKPLRAGTSGDSGVLVVTRVRSTNTKCTRDCGCNGHPAFPTPSLGGRAKQRLGRFASRGRERVSGIGKLSFRGDAKHRTRNLEIPRCAIAHLRSGPADHPGMTAMDLLAEPVIGRRATPWLAMTALHLNRRGCLKIESELCAAS